MRFYIYSAFKYRDELKLDSFFFKIFNKIDDFKTVFQAVFFSHFIIPFRLQFISSETAQARVIVIIVDSQKTRDKAQITNCITNIFYLCRTQKTMRKSRDRKRKIHRCHSSTTSNSPEQFKFCNLFSL